MSMYQKVLFGYRLPSIKLFKLPSDYIFLIQFYTIKQVPIYVPPSKINYMLIFITSCYCHDVCVVKLIIAYWLIPQ